MRNSENFTAYAEALFEGSLDCVKTLTLSGTLCRMNGRGLCAMEIADASMVLGSEWASLWPEQEQASARQSVAQAASGQSSRFQGYCPTAAGTPK